MDSDDDIAPPSLIALRSEWAVFIVQDTLRSAFDILILSALESPEEHAQAQAAQG
jgi:hypothetical protein